MESGLNPPQRVLDPPCLSLAGLLKVGIAVSGQEVEVRVGEPGDAAPKVGLQLPIRCVGACGLLEGVDLTHNLCYVPWATTEQHEMGKQTKRKSENLKKKISRFFSYQNFSPRSIKEFCL